MALPPLGPPGPRIASVFVMAVMMFASIREEIDTGVGTICCPYFLGFAGVLQSWRRDLCYISI